MTEPHIHQSHTAILRRLKRAEGHLRTIMKMMELDRSCLDVAQQLHAVEKAINAAKTAFVHDHIDHCLDHATALKGAKGATALREFKLITKYL